MKTYVWICPGCETERLFARLRDMLQERNAGLCPACQAERAYLRWAVGGGIEEQARRYPEGSADREWYRDEYRTDRARLAQLEQAVTAEEGRDARD